MAPPRRTNPKKVLSKKPIPRTVNNLHRSKPIYEKRPSGINLFFLRQKNNFYKIFIFFVFIFMIIGTSATFFHFLSSHEKMKIIEKIHTLDPLPIKSISIYGNKLTPQQEIINKINTKIGDSLLLFSVNDAHNKVDSLPFIEYSTVERRLPGNIVIIVKERKPIAIWQYKGIFNLIDEKGKEISTEGKNPLEIKRFQNLPIIVGKDANIDANTILSLLQKFPYIQNMTHALVKIGSRRWNIILDHNSQILLPEGQEDAVFKRLTIFYKEKLKIFSEPSLIIDMRLPDRMSIKILEKHI